MGSGLDFDKIPDRIDSWSRLAALVELFSYYNGMGWLFRGVTNSEYALVPKIGRVTSRAERDGQRIAYSEDYEKTLMERFKQHAVPYLNSEPSTELEWLSLAQHHGLPTRLLDWTEGLLVAAWFAVEMSDGGADGASWVARDIRTVTEHEHYDPNRSGAVEKYRPPHISGRMSAQGSVLVICPEPTQPLEHDQCKKIVVPHSAKFTIKKRLDACGACGVNRRMLFPDLGGLCDHLACVYKHDWLVGFRREPRLCS